MSGADRMMFGVDFPHPEGSWQRTEPWLRKCFAQNDLTERELRAICGGTAVDLYGIDAASLAPVAARVGPDVEQILHGDVPDDACTPWGSSTTAQSMADRMQGHDVEEPG